MSDVAKRLADLGPIIENLMPFGGTAGLSLGIPHHGKSVYDVNFGFRNVEQKLPMDNETIFPGCSLANALTSATLALLVEEEKLKWDTLVIDVLPGFDVNDESLQNHMAIADLLSHRTGISWGDNLYIGTNKNVLVAGKDKLKYLNIQNRLLPF